LTLRFEWVALNSLTSFCARVLETVRAQNWTVPVALTPKDADVGVEEVVPEDEQPAAASSRTAATPVKILPLKSFIALACLFSLRDWLGARRVTHWVTPSWRTAPPRGQGAAWPSGDAVACADTRRKSFS
jgi:hypothetical protein